MLSAAIPVLKAGAPNVEPLATVELSKLAHTIAYAHGELAAGHMSAQEGAAYLDLQRTSSRSALTGLPGMSLMTAEQAICCVRGGAREHQSRRGWRHRAMAALTTRWIPTWPLLITLQT